MEPIFTKLNYKEGTSLYVLNPPETFRNLLDTFTDDNKIRYDITPDEPIGFIIVFVKSKAELDELVRMTASALHGDAIFWLAYPKGTSKKYTCDFNRDTSWEIMAPYNMMPVRQISIDENWSALRFRKAGYIKSEKRKPVQD